MGIISWIIFGALAGWIASMIAKTNKGQGAIGNIVIGILGAVVGGWLAGFLFDSPGVTGFNFSSFVIAVLGALVLLLVKQVLTGKKSN